MTGTPRLQPVLRALALVVMPLGAWALEPGVPLDQYGHDRWGQREGLPQNSVTSIVQTRDGYLWFGTEEGLVRFNGLEFRRMPLPGGHRMVDEIALDENGRMWVASRDGALFVGDGARWNALAQLPGGHGVPHACRVHVESPARAWVRCSDSGVHVVDNGEVRSWSAPAEMGGQQTYEALRARDGALWVGTDRALWRVEAQVARDVDLQARGCSGSVDAMMEDADGTLWVATYDGALCSVRNGEVTRELDGNVLKHARIHVIRRDRAGAVWIGTARGLHRREKPDGAFSGVTALAGEDVYAVHEDAEGSLWVGSALSLGRLADTPFRTVGVPEGLAADSIRAICPARSGGVWLTLHEGAIYKVQDGNLALVNRRALPGMLAPRGCHEGADGTLWLGTTGAAHALTPAGVNEVNVPGSQGAAIAVTTDRGGALWVGGREGVHVRRGENWHFMGAETGFPEGAVLRLQQARDGTLWAGTLRGVARLEGERWVVVKSTARPGVTGFLEDDRGFTWLSSNEGLYRYSKGALSGPIREHHGLLDETPHVMLEDSEHRVWMSSNARGLFWVARDELDAVVDGRTSTVKSHPYGFADGLRAEEFNFGSPGGAVDGKGHLWFAGIAGAVEVNPARVKANNVPPPVHVDALIVDGAEFPVNAGGEITIPPGHERYEFRFDAATYKAPGRAQFSYLLEGYDTTWVAAGSRRSAYYTRLPPGRHAFRVRAANSDGAWNMEGASLAFRVEPYFWQTRWFLVGCVVVALAMLVAGFQWRVRTLQRRQRELEAQVAARTADLAREKARSDELLLNVLPGPIAERLKADPSPIADSYSMVTILFADIVGFTDLSARITPRELVDLLNEIFSEFDQLAAAHRVEKIKTIGDAYMVVAGVPEPRADHAVVICDMALEMIRKLHAINARRGLALRIRIGINSGPVVAGVIGKRKFSYDLWGDAVNTASRMESHGTPGRIHVSDETQRLISETFGSESRGTITVKGKGDMATHFLLDRKGKKSDGAP